MQARIVLCMARTTIAVEAETRDRLAELMQPLGVASLDAVLRELVFEHLCHLQLAQLDAGEAAEYVAEAQEWAELDVDVRP